MRTEIETLGHRFQLLLGDVYFRSDSKEALNSPEHMMAIGEYNLHECEKIETMDEEHQERIRYLIANMLAIVLQQEAILQYGNTNNDSIRQVLNKLFNRPEDRECQARLRETIKQALLSLDLNEEQCTSILVQIYDKLPDILVEYIAELVESIHMLPRSESQLIVMALADMMREEVS